MKLRQRQDRHVPAGKRLAGVTRRDIQELAALQRRTAAMLRWG